MSKQKRQKATAESIETETSAENPASGKFPLRLIGLGGCLVVGILLAIYFPYEKPAEQTPERPIGGVIECQGTPPFLRAVGFGQKAAFSTSERRIKGLILIQGERAYQHPTWKRAGRLGPITRDGQGNIFVAPAPTFDVWENKPEEQNKVFRVDGQTQEMKQLCDLPKAAPPTSQNPYGVLGLSFDCETNSLYVSSVAGSTRNEINGRIFQINADGKVLSQLEKTDAIGHAVFNSAKDKRLYFGQARTSEIWSIALDKKGRFSGAARKEVSLENLGPRGDDRARRITFARNRMIVFGIEFSFNLRAPTEKQSTVYHFFYDAAKDTWSYVAEPPQIVGES